MASDATCGRDPTPHAPGAPAEGYRFGDLLALARHSWLQRLSLHVGQHGFSEVRRSDPVLMRILARGPQPVGQLGARLGTSRQAARKLADGLVARGYAELADDPEDARRRLVRLNDRGLAYQRALGEAAELLNREVWRLSPGEIRGADAVLRAVLTEEDRRLADVAVPPPGG